MAVSPLLSSYNGLQQSLQVILGDLAASSDPNHSARRVQITTQVADGQITGVNIGPPQSFIDPHLNELLRLESTNLGFSETISSFYKKLTPLFGDINNPTSLTSQITRFQTALSKLAARPESIATRNEVIVAVQEITSSFNQIEKTLQDLRQDAETKIKEVQGKLTDNINEVIQQNLNIAIAVARNSSTSLNEDKRREALENIAYILPIRVASAEEGKVKILGPNNIDLMPAGPNTISLTQTSGITAAHIYPDTLQGLQIGGIDVTKDISGGQLKALFDLRDKFLPGLSEDFHQLASSLKEEFNAIHNNGAGFPPAYQLLGTKDVAGGDPLSASGTFRIGVVDANGTLINVSDINLAGINNVNQLIGAINGGGLGGNATASITPQGKLMLQGNNGFSVAINENTSNVLPENFTISLYRSDNTLIGNYNFQPGVDGSLQNLVGTMNAAFGINAVAELDGNRIHVSTRLGNKLSIDGYPKEDGTTIRSKGISHYFGLNDFFHGDIAPLNPHVTTSIKLNPTLAPNSNFLSTGVLSLTANIGQTAISKAGLLRPDGVTPVQALTDLFNNTFIFPPTLDLGRSSLPLLDYAKSILDITAENNDIFQKDLQTTTANLKLFRQEFDQKARSSVVDLSVLLTQLFQSISTVTTAMTKMIESEKEVVSLFNRV